MRTQTKLSSHRQGQLRYSSSSSSSLSSFSIFDGVIPATPYRGSAITTRSLRFSRQCLRFSTTTTFTAVAKNTVDVENTVIFCRCCLHRRRCRRHQFWGHGPARRLGSRRRISASGISRRRGRRRLISNYVNAIGRRGRCG